MFAAAGLVVLAIVLVSIGLTAVEFRRVPRHVFICRRCDAVFLRAAHREFPRECPRCSALDWARSFARAPVAGTRTMEKL